ncbi:PH domain-containing protein [Nocardioides scoriae]|uniref:PH domain-containing protein n=1 Tax=Nocardioides scoriae TaxID=642780 RepID=A0A1H1MZV2_9ACTN|nr:PH domain-containing protein [Nocardioides scoriae]SDR92391.1 PH domain-containing protein [Nocardioides scoriae]
MDRPETTEVVRSRAAVALGWSLVAVAVAGVASTPFGGLDAVLVYAAPLALLGLLAWAAFVRAHVEVSDGGVGVVNTLRSVLVPWPAVEAVDGRYGLRLATAYGPVQAWAAPAPAGRARARRESGPAAVVVQRRLEALRGAGHLEGARLEREQLDWRWDRPLLVAVGVLAAASVVLPLLA